MITLFGATGYTGRLVAQALSRRGLAPLRLAGRSPAKLARVAESLPNTPACLVADVKRTDTLPALCQDTRLLINCVGPFTDFGEAVLVQAVKNGISYVDISNELGYVYRMRAYDALARQAGAVVVPACGFEVVLADCAAAVLAQELAVSEDNPADELCVVYALGGRGSSFGTRRSAVRSLAASWLEYRDGCWNGAVPGRETRRVQLSGESRPALSFPSAETVTAPSHIAVDRVSTWLLITRGASLWAPTLIPLFAWLARGPAFSRLVLWLSTRFAPPPSTGLRSEAPFSIKVELRRGDSSKALTLTGRGVYDLTAEIVTYAAEQLLHSDNGRAGVLAPALVLNPQKLLDHATENWGIQVGNDV